MAVETKTPTSGDGRALAAALSAPAPFAGRTASMALHASDRHVDRWAPEQDATSRSRSLGTLSFVDRLLGPWLSGVATAPRPTGAIASSNEGRLPSVSWVFPRPWYQDELDWVAAAREGGDQTKALLTTRGTYAAPPASASRGTFAAPPALPPSAIAATVRTAGQTVVAVSEDGAQPLARRSLQSELAYVAPSFATGASTFVAESGEQRADAPTFVASPAGISVAAPASQVAAPSAGPAMAQRRALRAWSPQITFAAAQAAEVMSGVVGGVERAAFATSGSAAASHSPILEGLSYVAPAELAESYGPRATPAVAQASSTAPIARAVAQLAAAQAVASSRSPEAARAAIADTAAPVRAQAPAEAPAMIAYRAEQARVVEELTRREQAPAATSPAAAPASSFDDLVRIASSSPAAAQAMRAVELMARSALTGTVAPVSGPRVALPAGLGGAVIGHEAAVAARHPMVTTTPAAYAQAPTMLPSVLDEHGVPMPATPAVRAVPTFQPVWTAPFAHAQAPSVAAPAATADGFRARPGLLGSLQAAHTMPTAALAAIAADRPASVDHLAWTDRWLARFAGASPRSLAAVDMASERSTAVPRAFADGAPEVVFVIPGLEDAAPPVRAEAPRAATPTPARLAPPTAPRFADDDSVPDDVFAAIARSRAVRPPTATPTPTAAPVATPAPVRPTIADQIARSAPTAPDAGLYAGLASSPMAPALAGVMPLPAAPVFDPRALFAGGVISAYLGGAITRGAATGGAMTLWPATAAMPWAAPWIDAGPPAAALAEAPTLSVAGRAPATTFVAPDAFDGASPAPTSTAAPTAGVIARATATAPRADRSPEGGLGGANVPAWVAAATASADPTIWSLRAEPAMSAPSAVAAGSGASGAALDAPLGEVDADGWSARPGMTAELAHGFAIHTERAAADLSYDFVSPEQVLAARVYGFGPIEAAQAARLAVSGPAGLAAMASAIDLTFLRQLHIDAERGAPSPAAEASQQPRARREVSEESFDSGLAGARPSLRTFGAEAATTSGPTEPAFAPQQAAAASPPVFGVGRRLPRGVFLWPSGAVAALDLRADLPEGAAAMQVAALELLAANAVAEMGSLVAPHQLDDGDAPMTAPGVRAARAMPASFAAPMAAPASEPASPAPSASAVEPAVEQIAEAIAVPSSQRARFASIYLSLSSSPTGQSMSPSVRAARALAIATHQGRDDAGSTAQERAFAAWSVMPMVYSTPERVFAQAAEAGGAAADPGGPRFARQAMDVYAPDVADERPGLSGLAARAGQAIGSYVQPTAYEVERASSGAAPAGGSDAAARATREPFVHELIRQGRGFTRAGGGEVEIPGWFEAAAKRMLEQRGLGENLSMAELTLVASAPSSQVAASKKTASSSTPAAEAPAVQDKGEKPDIHKMAAEIYNEIRTLLDIARERSGDPWS